MGRDHRCTAAPECASYFNSHARVGRDSGRVSSTAAFRISTHTPAWGVTGVFSGHPAKRTDFNSHARVGRDYACTVGENAGVNFNSHARVGRDVIHMVGGVSALIISTHTPAWGVT